MSIPFTRRRAGSQRPVRAFRWVVDSGSPERAERACNATISLLLLAGFVLALPV